MTDIADEALDGSVFDGAAVGDFLLEELERSRERAHARHRRDDPDRSVPPDHAPAGRPAGRPGRARAPARPRSACIAPPGSSTPSRRRSRAAACSSSGRTARSWSTCRTSCPRSARTRSSSARSTIWSTVSSPSCAIHPPVAALKADTRMVDVIRRAAELRLEAEPRELAIRLEGSFIWVRAPEVRALLEAARAELGLTTRRPAAVPDEPAPPALRGVRTRARRRRLPQLRGRREGRAPERLPRCGAEGGLAGRAPRPARPLAAHAHARRLRRPPTASSTPTSRSC